jgi:pimeloyl-ACP methyl ester carboxylesterase
LRVGDGTKPLLARDHIGAIGLWSRDRRVGADVTAALYLGQELRTSFGVRIVGVEQRRQEPVANRGVRRSPKRPREADRAHRRTRVAGFALERQQVQKCRLLVGATRSTRVSDEAALPHHRAGAVVVGIEAHRLDSAADAVVARQLGQVRTVLVTRARRTYGADDSPTETGRVLRERGHALSRQRHLEQPAQRCVGGERIVGELGAPSLKITPSNIGRHEVESSRRLAPYLGIATNNVRVRGAVPCPPIGTRRAGACSGQHVAFRAHSPVAPCPVRADRPYAAVPFGSRAVAVREGSIGWVDEHPQDELLAWHRTEVLGRVASYGVGGKGPPVLFLHGWGLSGHTYRAALERLLARGLRVWAPALPGFDGSAALPDDAALEDYAAWVDAFCAEVGIHGSVVLMGHSFGGGVAIQTAHDFPARARALVLINSIGGSAWRHHGSVVQSLAERPLWDWGLHLPRDVLPLRQLRRVLPVIIEAAIPNAVRNPRAFWHAATICRYANLTDELDKLKARRLPVVVLWGNRDEIVTRASFDAMCAALGGPLSVTVDGSHSWMLADPDGFGEVITNMLAIALEAQAEERKPRARNLATLAPGPAHDAA